MPKNLVPYRVVQEPGSRSYSWESPQAFLFVRAIVRLRLGVNLRLELSDLPLELGVLHPELAELLEIKSCKIVRLLVELRLEVLFEVNVLSSELSVELYRNQSVLCHAGTHD